jgi:hypothetical protein
LKKSSKPAAYSPSDESIFLSSIVSLELSSILSANCVMVLYNASRLAEDVMAAPFAYAVVPMRLSRGRSKMKAGKIPQQRLPDKRKN